MGEQRPGPAAPEAPAAPAARYRVHHSFIWLNCLRAAAAIVAFAAVSLATTVLQDLVTGSTEGLGLTLLYTAVVVVCALVLLVVFVAYYALAWRYLSYELGPEELTVCSGIFVKKRRHVPYRRIQSVDQKASLLQRVCGVCTVTVDTAGGAENSALEVPYVRRDQAEELRRELFARKHSAAPQTPAAAPQAAAVPQQPTNVLDAPAGLWEELPGLFGGRSIDTGRITYEYGLSNRELVLTGLSGPASGMGSAVGLLALLAALAELASTAAEAMGDAAFERMVLGALGAGVLAAALVVAVVVAWLVSAAGTFIAYGGFRARRRAGRIEVERGLLQHRIQGVEVDRVQYVRVRQGFIRRLMGYCELSVGKVNAVSGGSASEGGAAFGDGGELVIHPFVKLTAVPGILEGIIPEFSGVPPTDRAVAPCALRRALIRRVILRGTGFWLAVALGVFQAALFVGVPGLFQDLPGLGTAFVAGYALCALGAAVEAVDAVLWARGSGFSFNGRYVQMSNGGLSRDTVAVPRTKLQHASVRTNPLQRRARTATVGVRTAAGTGGTSFSLVDAREQDAAAYVLWARPRGNVLE